MLNFEAINIFYLFPLVIRINSTSKKILKVIFIKIGNTCINWGLQALMRDSLINAGINYNRRDVWISLDKTNSMSLVKISFNC